MRRVGVIMGGVSSEYEVSLNTGREMLKHLDRSKYEGVPVVISSREELVDAVKGLDFALLALHGAYGEDGTVQGTLETLGIPYSGSGVLSSSLCMDKALSKTILRSKGVNTPAWICLDRMEDFVPEAVEKLGYPVMVKPNSGGSSIGMTKVNSRAELRSAVEKAFAADRSVLIEEYTEGQEITCPILGGKMLPVIGIRSLGADWFDYSAKYELGGAEEQVIQLPAELEERVRAAALTCYQALKCTVYARVDMLLKDGIPYVLEVNTLPGMTETSLLPRSALASGYTFSGLLDEIISGSLAERRGIAAGPEVSVAAGIPGVWGAQGEDGNENKQDAQSLRDTQALQTVRQGAVNYG
ncbi:D-alanine--D-alanine ligase [Paenibacillus sp. 22594]|uniref:D-alanine--D-alanine ligase n=1 Tax=Paenibacillus sp. 22594 TaxID=3453947 RepID=UPI003F84C409